MKLVPTLGLGPKRLARRPVETLLLVLSVALGTLATVTAVDALAGILGDLDRTAQAPWVRMVVVWDQDREKWTAVMSDQRYQAATKRFDHPGDYSAWLDRVSPNLPGLETSYFDFGAAARVRVDEHSPWTQAGRSFCAQPSLFQLPEVSLVAGRILSRQEFDRGEAGVVIGVNLAAILFPGLSPGALLGREVEVNRNFWEPETARSRILGVCRQVPGSSPGANGDPGDWLVVGRKALEPWGQATFLAKNVDEVPALVARLKTLLSQDPSVASMAVGDSYGEYEKKRTLSAFVAVLTLGIGAGTLLISLWTLGSVFRTRIPSLKRTRNLLRALGASQTTLLGMDLSEILPVSLGGFVLGALGSVGVRVFLLGQVPLHAYDGFLVAGLVLTVVGLPFAQVRFPIRVTARDKPRQPLRLVTTVGFLTLGLAGSSMALSLAEDLGRSLPKLEIPLPLWAGLVRSQQDESHYPDELNRITGQDLVALARVIPASWSPVISQTGQMESTTIKVPTLENRRFWIRNKVLGRPNLIEIFGLPLVAGALPDQDKPDAKLEALVSEEVAETLFGSSAGALGRVIVDVEREGETTEIAYEVTGVFSSPTGPQSDLGAPDLVFVPRAAYWARPGTGFPGLVLAFHPRTVSLAAVKGQVVDLLKTAHPGANVEAWSGARQQTVARDWADRMKTSAKNNLTVIVLLAGLFLVVSCLGVLGDLFVRITGRAHAIAVERALGRPFVHFIGQSFLRGALMVLGASILAVAISVPTLPILSSSLSPFLGDLTLRSTGRVDLALFPILLVTLGAALLSGLIAILPLLPYRKGPLAAQIGGAS